LSSYLDHITTDQLRAVLAQPDERVVNIVHGEHDAQIFERVHRSVAMICNNVRREKLQEFESAVSVRRVHHGDLDALLAEAGDPPRPLTSDVASLSTSRPSS
jgi:hypothetical protein